MAKPEKNGPNEQDGAASQNQASEDPPARTELAGQNVVVTRAVNQADATRIKLQRLGAQVLPHPVIEILPPEDWSELDNALERLEGFGWLVIASPNVVRFLAQRIGELDLAERLPSLQALGQLRIATIGQATETELSQLLKVQSDLTPHVSNGEALASELAKQASGQRLLIPRGSRRSPGLTDELDIAEIEYEQPLVYISRDVEASNPIVAQALTDGKVDWVTVTSPAIARATVRIFGAGLNKAKLVSISPGTSEVLNELGFPPAAEAVKFDIDGLLDAMVRHE